ncbi:ORF6N domain-containing protein [Bacillus sp. FJAT-49705]|uniref:ORF6N domain-containing protein n=1 Tax=Cytobacillus citreus TaxID=2833586 RepID=A0ABS5NY20_9BACI|nr:ORF6N domain-containing protein [Cytobacillus citreus]MBS4191779.1 ORF6N domain-containing protein [Cytobacillus citreus]
MIEIQVIEREGMRVLTTTQLAQSFNVDSKIINRNYQRNRERYEQGKHFFSLAGEQLKEFKALRQNDVSLKFASILYLWTEKGAWMLAKSLNNDKAWQAYELLVDSYFNITKRLNSPDELLKVQGEKIVALESKLYECEKKVLAIEQNMFEQITLQSGEQRRLQRAVAERVYTLEKNKDKHSELYRGIYSSLKRQFKVKSYRDVKRHELQTAIRFVEHWNG